MTARMSLKCPYDKKIMALKYFCEFAQDNIHGITFFFCVRWTPQKLGQSRNNVSVVVCRFQKQVKTAAIYHYIETR
jgi:hypothetical protein